MKNILHIRTLALGAVITVLFSAFSYALLPANFSGTWALNEGKSELGEFGTRGAASKIVVAQQADGVKIDKTNTGFSGEEVLTEETLTNDGKESETTIFGSSKKKSTLKWSDDQAGFTIKFTINFNMNGQSFDMNGTEAWSISEDGKTLTLSTTINTPNGEISTKAVYDKK